MPQFVRSSSHLAVALIISCSIHVLHGQNAEPSAQRRLPQSILPVDQRVDDLISRMTLEEKASQLVNQARAIPRLAGPGIRLVE